MTGIWAGLPPGIAALLMGASFLGSFITISMGIGGGAFLLAIMASLMPPAALIPVHGVVQLGSNALRAVVMRHHLFRAPILAFGGGTVLGALAGGLVVVELPPPAIQIGVGLFVIWSVLARPPGWLIRAPALTGALASFLTMFFGATGVFVAGYVKSLDLGRQAYVATHATMMSLQHLLKIVVFGLLGFALAPWLPLIAGMIAAGFAGTLAGRAILLRLPEALFRRILDGVLMLLAASLVLRGLVGL